MDFRIADTFTDTLARLTGAEQKAVDRHVCDDAATGRTSTLSGPKVGLGLSQAS